MTFRCRILWDFTVYIVAGLRLNFKGLLVKDCFAACCAGKFKQMSRELFNVSKGESAGQSQRMPLNWGKNGRPL